MANRNPKIIFLEPLCATCNDNIDEYSGRMWCEDDVWSGECENCGVPVEAVEYKLVEGKKNK